MCLVLGSPIFAELGRTPALDSTALASTVTTALLPFPSHVSGMAAQARERRRLRLEVVVQVAMKAVGSLLPPLFEIAARMSLAPLLGAGGACSAVAQRVASKPG